MTITIFFLIVKWNCIRFQGVDRMIKLDEKAKQFIEAKGRHLTINNIEVKGCCAPGVQDLLAIPKKPKNLDSYLHYSIDNLTIYVQKNIHLEYTLSLSVSGVGFFKGISITRLS